MITATQLKIFDVLARKPFSKHTRKEIKKESKEKSNNTLALTINLLKKEEILLEEKIGKSGILTLNLENDLTYQYIALSNNNKLNALTKQSIEYLKKEISENTPFYSIVIFGSYALGKENKNSDIDIAIFIEDKKKQVYLEALANSAKLKSAIEMDIHIIPQTEMIEMLTNNEENLGKQIARKHLAIYNHKIFYDIIIGGIKRGFRI
ncbi:MAG: nucleotidyltransferase domain-containing protein [Nanoarchaeota archaeon]|nr:nucleotidyltransferase domain-containing protein [Nanoarchaeota archaeon]MBU1603877.1 nucleotidyltransferase domain-containing protein [Nanoarchaeota archaeon]MBU2443636.1 nucleotidyltransferase domain-containing protein [Nanoarchaeota archaeon]